MNVAIFTDNDFQKVNGVTTVLKSVLAHAPSDCRPRVYTCDSEGAAAPDYFALKARGIGIPYYSEMKMYWPPFRRLVREAQADGIELIHLTTPGPVGLAALWVASRLGLPMVGSFHTHLAEYTARLSGSARLGALMGQYMRWPYGACQQVLAPSEATRQVLVDLKIDPRKLRIWARGVSTERFSPAHRREPLRDHWGVSKSRPAIIYVGRLSREKGLDDVPAIQRALEQAGVAHRFIFVGDGPMRRTLEENCHDAVFTGSLSHDEVAVAMASSDLFLFPSRTDTAGNVVLEAQASGLPVLVSNEGGPQEHMIAGATGEVCADVAGFIARTRQLLSNASVRFDYGRAARAYAFERRWDVSLAPLFKAYREVGASRASAATLSSHMASSSRGVA